MAKINSRFVDGLSIAKGAREAGWLFGKPVLISGGNGRANWQKGSQSLSTHQKGSGILAHLYGGAQTGDDWASCYILTNELPVTQLDSLYWSWYQTNNESMGLGTVIWIHDPLDFDKRAEVTQLANVSGLDKSAGQNSHEFDSTVTQMFFYGENTTGTDLTAGTQYTWDEFQADTLFSTWSVYRISFDWGWDASGTYESAWLSEIKINGLYIPLDPSFVEYDIKTGIGNGRGICNAAGTANQVTTTTTPCKVIIFTAETDNTGTIVLGGASIDETLASRSGTPLLAGDSTTMEIDDISKVYIDAATTGDGVTFTYFW